MDKRQGNGFTVSEQTDRFTALFTKKKNDLENNILKAEQLEKEKLTIHFDFVNEDFQKLQKYLSDSTIFLPFYNVRSAQEAIKRLQDLIFATQDKFIPKKKFTFKKKSSSKSASNDSVDAPVKIKTDCIKEYYVGNHAFFELSNQNLELQDDINGKDVELSKLKECNIKIFGAPSTLHLSNLNDCRIYVGPVATSVFIEDCFGCIFVVACQQLRVHSTKSCNFYLHVTSRAIIEDSVELRFAPYNWTYNGLDRHYEYSGLDREKNNWDIVDDFNWLSTDKPSPNWSVLEDGDRDVN